MQRMKTVIAAYTKFAKGEPFEMPSWATHLVPHLIYPEEASTSRDERRRVLAAARASRQTPQSDEHYMSHLQSLTRGSAIELAEYPDQLRKLQNFLVSRLGADPTWMSLVADDWAKDETGDDDIVTIDSENPGSSTDGPRIVDKRKTRKD